MTTESDCVLLYYEGCLQCSYSDHAVLTKVWFDDGT